VHPVPHKLVPRLAAIAAGVVVAAAAGARRGARLRQLVFVVRENEVPAVGEGSTEQGVM
jgi:hypothetical protein